MPRMFDILRGRVDNQKSVAKGTFSKEDSKLKKVANLVVNFPRQIHDAFSAKGASEDAQKIETTLQEIAELEAKQKDAEKRLAFYREDLNKAQEDLKRSQELISTNLQASKNIDLKIANIDIEIAKKEEEKVSLDKEKGILISKIDILKEKKVDLLRDLKGADRAKTESKARIVPLREEVEKLNLELKEYRERIGKYIEKERNYKREKALGKEELDPRESRKLIDAVKKKGLDGPQIAKEKYEHTHEVVKVLLERMNKGESPDLYAGEIYKAVDSLTNQLILGSSLLENIAEAHPTGNYLSWHTTNVCILSLAVGMQMNFNKSKLHILGVAALLHDIGMLSVKDIIGQPRELLDYELREVKNHALKGGQIISKMKDYYGAIREIIEQHHERINGGGYPLSLKRGEINDYAKILGLVDTYEAMTHPRTYRQGKMPHEALREIMSSLKLFFEPTIIKALVDKISIYPVGSFIKFNTGEIAKVVSPNASFPLRPVVLILLDSYAKPIAKPKTIDLSKDNSVYIKGPISGSDGKVYGKV